MKYLTSVAAAIAAAVSVSAAHATTIDFETNAPDDFIQTSPLTNFYSGLGVTFAGVDGNGGSILDQASNFGINAHSGSDFLAFNINVGTGDAEAVNFTTPVTNFSIFVGDGTGATYTASAFDANGTLLGSSSVSPGGGVYGELVISSPNISQVVFSGPGFFVADDLSFNTSGGVPEPALWAMMLVGFGSAGALIRSRRRSLAIG
jgi:hypothetical protein